MSKHVLKVELERDNVYMNKLVCEFDADDLDRPCRWTDENGELTDQTGCSLQDFVEEDAFTLECASFDIAVDVEWHLGFPTLIERKDANDISANS